MHSSYCWGPGLQSWALKQRWRYSLYRLDVLSNFLLESNRGRPKTVTAPLAFCGSRWQPNAIPCDRLFLRKAHSIQLQQPLVGRPWGCLTKSEASRGKDEKYRAFLLPSSLASAKGRRVAKQWWIDSEKCIIPDAFLIIFLFFLNIMQ